MSQIIVAYWSGTGNTEMMAQAIGKGIEAAAKASCEKLGQELAAC